MENQPSGFENRVIVVGVGLIGGSIAAAVRQRYPDCEVIGVGRSADRLKAAQSAGLLTSWTTNLTSDVLTAGTLVVVCLPVDMIADSVKEIAAKASDDVVITDAGSVKGLICDQLKGHKRAEQLFVPAHPIAGGEQGGFEYADSDLFCNRVCVVMNSANTAHQSRTTRFWQLLGCRIVQMSAEEHDRVLALTSHLPHVIAVITTSTVGAENFGLTGSGFRDTTRIAAGSASLWTAILAGNRDQVVAALRAAETALQEFRSALEQHDDKTVTSLLHAAAVSRSMLD